ncbi:molybdenum ABC transporter ATP-binding protein [Salinarimonas soli]|uniref:Molybdenum ABC transporter ATP-binding protein n=1 Tax=Salinarimonas soli TaxID=1638099 RepID=A0A5B2VFV2_9HYPH|nr:molybdenum ABC transporter ATP-binding protein [Salinarimonas soli]
MLQVDVDKSLGETAISVAFATRGRVTALFGPSGSGKTSVVNMVAGLLTPDRGRIAIGDDVLFDSERRVCVPVHRRRIGYVFQEGRLLPHLSVRSNLAFGRWMNGLRRDADEERRVVEMLGIGGLLRRRPLTLSGGERQRVAIGRALLLRPRLLLLDEPLASLDEARKAEILPYLERLRDEAGTPMIYVSHAEAEVRRLADEVVRLAAGRVVGTRI